MLSTFFFFFSSRRRHTRCSRDWSSDVCSSDLTCIGKAAVVEVSSTPQETWPDRRDERNGGPTRAVIGLALVQGLVQAHAASDGTKITCLLGHHRYLLTRNPPSFGQDLHNTRVRLMERKPVDLRSGHPAPTFQVMDHSIQC